MSLATQLAAIGEKISNAAIKSGRRPADVKLVAVTKTFSSDVIRRAHALGLRDFAENYVQEAIPKMDDLRDLDLRWHFIGHLQSNKAKIIADQFALIHSVDREKIAAVISEHSSTPQDVLVEVNLAQETSKSGCSPEALPSLLDSIQGLKNLKLSGLMFMPPLDLAPREQQRFFSQARELRDQMASSVSTPHSLIELSMGTSHDFEVAIAEGATVVRLGTALFGAR